MTRLMARRLLTLLACLVLPLYSAAASLSGQVVAVPDANRIILQTEDGRRLPIALLGLAVPGSANRQWRKIGRRHLQMLLSGRFITVDTTMRDKRGVIFGVVRHGGADMGLRLLRSGLAVTRDHTALSSALKGAYQQAEQEARRRGMGYWQETR
jgi:endonuclease YncB( thermonuclease family)